MANSNNGRGRRISREDMERMEYADQFIGGLTHDDETVRENVREKTCLDYVGQADRDSELAELGIRVHVA